MMHDDCHLQYYMQVYNPMQVFAKTVPPVARKDLLTTLLFIGKPIFVSDFLSKV